MQENLHLNWTKRVKPRKYIYSNNTQAMPSGNDYFPTEIAAYWAGQP